MNKIEQLASSDLQQIVDAYKDSEIDFSKFGLYPVGGPATLILRIEEDKSKKKVHKTLNVSLSEYLYESMNRKVGLYFKEENGVLTIFGLQEVDNDDEAEQFHKAGKRYGRKISLNLLPEIPSEVQILIAYKNGIRRNYTLKVRQPKQ